MAGLADLALGVAPIFGGALLGVAAGQLKGPDFRGAIKADLDLLDRIPEEETARRAALRHSINQRIDDLVEANRRSRELRAAAASYEGNWRDIVLLISVVLFTIIWWAKDKHDKYWLPMLAVLLVLCVVTAYYAFRGVHRGLAQLLRRKPD